MTVFDVGRRGSLTDQALAAYDYQVAAYRQNVLTGFQQVKDNLAAVRILEDEAKVQDEAVVAAQGSLAPFHQTLQGRGHELSRGNHSPKCGSHGRGRGGQYSGTADGEYGLTDPRSWWRMGPFKSAGAAGMLRQASEQQFQ